MQKRCLACILLGIAVNVAACRQKVTPQEVAAQLNNDPHVDLFSIKHYTCQDGQGDWDYICEVRYEPTAISVQRGEKPRVRRVGLRVMGHYRGKLSFGETVLPDYGPAPSANDLMTARKAEAAAAAERSRERTRRIVGQ